MAAERAQSRAESPWHQTGAVINRFDNSKKEDAEEEGPGAIPLGKQALAEYFENRKKRQDARRAGTGGDTRP